ncbi:MAG: hypothetical protein JNK37_04140 [Verrucomicrobiales bacterium]|nr:hypothetical protein [Verrucomicrobiales bacterium]
MSNPEKPTPTPETAQKPAAASGSEANPVLTEALDKQRPRYFRVSGGAARGRSGRADTERFADELMTLQECAQIVGERLEMNAIAFGVIYDGDETIAFRYDPNSDPRKPDLVGGLVNRRMAMRELLAGLNHYMNE